MDTAHQVSLSFTISLSLLKLISTESVMPSNPLISCHLLLLPLILPSIRVFSTESVLGIRWPKYWSCSFSIHPSNEYSGLISFRMAGWISLLSKGLLRILSSTTVQKHQYPVLSLLYGPTLTSAHDYWLEKPQFWVSGPLSAEWCLCLLTHCLGLSYLFFQGASIF